VISISSKTVETPDGPVIQPDGEIPCGWHVRYEGGEFRAIPPGEKWLDEPAEPDAT
jgi:hypothetical protein